jgi:hypothetical protein
MKLQNLLVCLAIAVATTGCATIMAGGPDRVNVNSNPPGANVFLDDQLVGQTPMVVTLDRDKSRGLIRIEQAGFQPVVMQRSKQINGWFWANLCFGGVIGIVVDLVTGDVKRFDDSPIAVGMTPAYGPEPAPAAPEAAPAPAPGTTGP